MPVGRRVLLGMIALVPLMAPYELLLKPGWQQFLHPAFLIAALVSLGALAVSGLLAFAAVAGLDERLTIDLRSRTLTYWQRAPVVRATSVQYSFSDLIAFGVVVNQWSEGPDTYSLSVLRADGGVIRFGSLDSHDQAAGYVARLNDVIGVPSAS